MTKLYYDDAVVAAYMYYKFMIKFIGVNYEYKNDNCTEESRYETYKGEIENFIGHEELYCPYDRYYIHSDSMPIFEPKEGDLIHGKEKYLDVYKRVDDIVKSKSIVTGFWSDGLHYSLTDDFEKWTIIQRDGKAFFMPKEKE